MAEPDSPFTTGRIADLEAELGRARTIIDRAADAIFHLDSDGRTTFANPAAEQMFGWAEDELLGKKLHEVVHYKHPDGSPFPMCECPLGNVFSTGRTLRLHEDTFWDRNGAAVPVACSNAAVVTNGEVQGGVLIVRDIRERVRADEERKLLLNELNHRVKNTLSVVQSIARQTFGSARSDGRVDGFEARLSALSAAHGLLVERTWADPTLQEIAELALAPFGQLGLQIRIDGPEVRLSAKTAVAMTLAFHELATNASKYGALSIDGGSVTCEWRLISSDGHGLLEITWLEAGGPPVVAPQRRGFGTRMIEKALATEISGQVALHFAPEGVRCVIVGTVPGTAV